MQITTVMIVEKLKMQITTVMIVVKKSSIKKNQTYNKVIAKV